LSGHYENENEFICLTSEGHTKENRNWLHIPKRYNVTYIPKRLSNIVLSKIHLIYEKNKNKMKAKNNKLK
jgi:hypothetical protein